MGLPSDWWSQSTDNPPARAPICTSSFYRTIPTRTAYRSQPPGVAVQRQCAAVVGKMTLRPSRLSRIGLWLKMFSDTICKYNTVSVVGDCVLIWLLERCSKLSWLLLIDLYVYFVLFLDEWRGRAVNVVRIKRANAKKIYCFKICFLIFRIGTDIGHDIEYIYTGSWTAWKEVWGLERIVLGSF